MGDNEKNKKPLSGADDLFFIFKRVPLSSAVNVWVEGPRQAVSMNLLRVSIALFIFRSHLHNLLLGPLSMLDHAGAVCHSQSFCFAFLLRSLTVAFHVGSVLCKVH